jgi:hypothetical protein
MCSAFPQKLHTDGSLAFVKIEIFARAFVPPEHAFG